MAPCRIYNEQLVELNRLKKSKTDRTAILKAYKELDKLQQRGTTLLQEMDDMMHEREEEKLVLAWCKQAEAKMKSLNLPLEEQHLFKTIAVWNPNNPEAYLAARLGKLRLITARLVREV
jgi:hypothetical protein